MLSKEPSFAHLNGGQFISPGSVTESQPYIQRQTLNKLSVKKIHRPASVPSTKKFEDCGVSSINIFCLYFELDGPVCHFFISNTYTLIL